MTGGGAVVTGVTSASEPGLLLTVDELVSLTGFKTASRQVLALHALGFWLARRTPLGVALPRAHYEAVCKGARMGGVEVIADPLPPIRTLAIRREAAAKRA